jgi:hypothetical protein
VLRRLDSDVPAMGFFHGLMLEAKKEISERFDNDESRLKGKCAFGPFLSILVI